MAGALLVHVAVLILLFVVGFTLPEKQEEGGVPVLMGEVNEAGSQMDPSLVEVDVLPDEAVMEPAEALQPEMPADDLNEMLLTQHQEESVAIPPKKEKPKEKEKPKKEVQPKKEVKPQPLKPEKTEAQKAEEARKAAEAEAARKAAEAEKARKAAEEAARKRVAGAFGKGAKMADSEGNSKGNGVQGNPAGNASTGKSTGTGGYGAWDLGGRSLGEGGLPRPVYNVQDEGRVVVDITVNPAGRVIATAINRRTNTVNPALRKAAEDAARKATFNAVSGLNNQQGTITYFFNLK